MMKLVARGSVVATAGVLAGAGDIAEDWPRMGRLLWLNLDIVLIVEECKYVLTEVCPQKPNEGATDEETQAYRKWIKADEMARCYTLAFISNVLQHQHQSMPSTYDIMQNLKEMFRDQNHAARQTTMKELMNTTMAEGTPIRYHVLKIIGLLNEL
ncbi:uncharacterized protein LOC131160946 [Malania oleifera]|uniref:uncharacterized protein LOC131160946 n=1 Tax=Malania oleifera TaxID=397392 RepID=UPI0025ADF52B|nr:uncharacterized protein LOC131160946 [Malania oleifera]